MQAMYVCICNGITDHQIREAADNGCSTVTELTMRTGCGSNCGSCLDMAGELLAKAHDPNSPDRSERPPLRDEVRAKLTVAEIGTLQTIFKKLDVPYIAADAVSGLHVTPALPTHKENEQ